MSRKEQRPPAKQHYRLEPQRKVCVACEQPMWVAYHIHRTLMTLQGWCGLTIVVRRCRTPTCPRYQHPYRPEEEGRWALPHGECGLDVIALIGSFRFREHRSVPEMHRMLLLRGVSITERSVTHLMQRYEELVTLRITDHERIKTRRQQARPRDARLGWTAARCGP